MVEPHQDRLFLIRIEDGLKGCLIFDISTVLLF